MDPKKQLLDTLIQVNAYLVSEDIKKLKVLQLSLNDQFKKYFDKMNEKK